MGQVYTVPSVWTMVTGQTAPIDNTGAEYVLDQFGEQVWTCDVLNDWIMYGVPNGTVGDPNAVVFPLRTDGGNIGQPSRYHVRYGITLGALGKHPNTHPLLNGPVGKRNITFDLNGGALFYDDMTAYNQGLGGRTIKTVTRVDDVMVDVTQGIVTSKDWPQGGSNLFEVCNGANIQPDTELMHSTPLVLRLSKPALLTSSKVGLTFTNPNLVASRRNVKFVATAGSQVIECVSGMVTANDVDLVTPSVIQAPMTARVVATSNVALSGLQIVDGTQLLNGDHVLLVAQNDSTQNGVYLASSGGWTRGGELDASADVVRGLTWAIEEGSFVGTCWSLTTATTDVSNPNPIGTTALDFVQTITQSSPVGAVQELQFKMNFISTKNVTKGIVNFTPQGGGTVRKYTCSFTIGSDIVTVNAGPGVQYILPNSAIVVGNNLPLGTIVQQVTRPASLVLADAAVASGSINVQVVAIGKGFVFQCSTVKDSNNISILSSNSVNGVEVLVSGHFVNDSSSLNGNPPTVVPTGTLIDYVVTPHRVQLADPALLSGPCDIFLSGIDDIEPRRNNGTFVIDILPHSLTQVINATVVAGSNIVQIPVGADSEFNSNMQRLAACATVLDPTGVTLRPFPPDALIVSYNPNTREMVLDTPGGALFSSSVATISVYSRCDGLKVLNGSVTGGKVDRGYDASRENWHGFRIGGVYDFEVKNCTIDHHPGDLMYFNRSVLSATVLPNGQTASINANIQGERIVVEGNLLRWCGRQGVTLNGIAGDGVTDGSGLHFRFNTMNAIGRFNFDSEPFSSSYLNEVLIEYNSFDVGNLGFMNQSLPRFARAGNVVVQYNFFSDGHMTFTCGTLNAATTPRNRFVVRNNTTAAPPGNAVFNKTAFSKPLIHLGQWTDITITGNISYAKIPSSGPLADAIALTLPSPPYNFTQNSWYDFAEGVSPALFGDGTEVLTTTDAAVVSGLLNTSAVLQGRGGLTAQPTSRVSGDAILQGVGTLEAVIGLSFGGADSPGAVVDVGSTVRALARSGVDTVGAPSDAVRQLIIFSDFNGDGFETIFAPNDVASRVVTRWRPAYWPTATVTSVANTKVGRATGFNIVRATFTFGQPVNAWVVRAGSTGPFDGKLLASYSGATVTSAYADIDGRQLRQGDNTITVYGRNAQGRWSLKPVQALV